MILPIKSTKQHHYHTTLTWWYNPEGLLIASMSSSHMLWYPHLCTMHGIVLMDYTDAAEGPL